MFSKNTIIVFVGGFSLLLLTMIFAPMFSGFVFLLWAMASVFVFFSSRRAYQEAEYRENQYADDPDDSGFNFDSLKEKLSFKKTNENRHTSTIGSTKEEQELFDRLSKELQDMTDKEYDPPIPLERDTFNPFKWGKKSKRK